MKTPHPIPLTPKENTSSAILETKLHKHRAWLCSLLDLHTDMLTEPDIPPLAAAILTKHQRYLIDAIDLIDKVLSTFPTN